MQPWASLIVAGAKPYEFRTWRPHAAIVGQRIVIHAGVGQLIQAEASRIFLARRDGTAARRLAEATLTVEALPILARAWAPRGEPLPSAAGIGTVIIGAPRPGADVAAAYGELCNPEPGEAWAWPLLDIERWPIPVPARGQQGLWRWPAAGC